jgi:hypothetical protein
VRDAEDTTEEDEMVRQGRRREGLADLARAAGLGSERGRAGGDVAVDQTGGDLVSTPV